MKFSDVISKLHRISARVFWAWNVFDSLGRGHAAAPKRIQEVNLINSDQTQTNDDAGQGQLVAPKTGAMECWLIGPNYTWCNSGRVRN